VVISFFFISSISSFAQSADDIYKQLTQRITTSKAVQADFAYPNFDHLSGTLIVTRGNRFRIDMPDRSIISDGKSVWNYAITQNKVIVSNQADGMGAVSPETLFMDFPTTYEPRLKKYRSSKGESDFLLTLTPKDSVIAGLDTVRLTLSSFSLDISSIEVASNGTTQAWNISNFSTSIQPADSLFTFPEQPTDTIRVIDLR
jgi:outer membrane lipoprotein-sorting protein